MKCKKHLTDFSSSVGVCASCLRERLFVLIAAQYQAQAHIHAQGQAQALEDRRKSDAHPPPLVFPRSVSPYITHRKADIAAWPQHSLPDVRFYSTPQVGPTGGVVTGSLHKKQGKFSLFSNLIRSKSQKPYSDPDPRLSVSEYRESCTVTSSSPSPSWFSNIFSGRRKKQLRLFFSDESTAGESRRPWRNRGQVMSPARHSEYGADEKCHDVFIGNSSEPRRTAPLVRQGGGRPSNLKNGSGLAFCLSPLVRASPNRHWNQKGMPPETALSGENRVPVKAHLSTASPFCANRSRKMADFGRSNLNR